MKKSIIASLLLFIVCYASAQTDSLVLVSAHWQSQQIAKGVILKQYQFKGNLFGSNQSIHILEIIKPKKIDFSIGYDAKILKQTSEFGREHHALAALNGTFFDTKNGGSVDLIKADRKIVQQNQLANGKRGFHQKSALAISKGKLRVEKWDETSDWENKLQADEIMVSGPLLLKNQTQGRLDSTSFNLTRHPRTAVFIGQSGKIMLITVDGRHENAAGMSLFELQKIARWLSSKDAINLDGGGSTTLWIGNQPGIGVVNYPCDNRKWDHEGERKVANVLLVKKSNR
jgi:exopolysaccharide biosynthesis protein